MDEALRNLADFLHEVGECNADDVVAFICNNWDKIDADVHTYRTKEL